MNLTIYSLKDLLVTALKSEVESRNIYTRLAESVENFLLKDRFNFLASEEEKHRAFFENLFKQKFPQRKISLPKKSPVPLPQINFDEKNFVISEILLSAMKAEKAAYDFYTKLTKRFKDSPEIQKMLHYIASMEMGHYRILELEKENAEKFESHDIEWPLMHVGP
ncbi:MAG: ferritin family protein [candidate division WOR-3 bacterium]|nr:ferritin family protein [candidate division WOR-3 bacterium]